MVLQLLYKNLNRGESYIDSAHWINIKKATNNPINKNDNKCCYAPICNNCSNL